MCRCWLVSAVTTSLICRYLPFLTQWLDVPLLAGICRYYQLDLPLFAVFDSVA